MIPYRHRFRVPFDQLDPGGVLFFGHLFTHLHHAFEGFLREIGFGLPELLAGGHITLPVAHAEADYHRPLGLDDRVEVTVAVREVGERRFVLDYRFHRDGEACASATTVHVAVDRSTGRPCPLPDPLRQGLSRYPSSS